MKILVPIKRVVDYNVVVRPTLDKMKVDTENVKMSINPFDEIALEEAIRIRESGKAEEVVVVTCGDEKCRCANVVLLLALLCPMGTQQVLGIHQICSQLAQPACDPACDNCSRSD